MVSSTGLCLDNIPALDIMPIGGRVSQCVSNWKIVCSNTWVLDVISNGYCIPLETIPRQDSIPSNPVAVGEAHEILVKEALTLKEKQAIAVVEHCDGEYISTYFAVPKPNRPGQYRPILNLKYFNENVKKYKFSMESVRSIREWLQPNAFCIGLDLADAFLHLPFHDSSKKYLRFKWLGELLEWQVIVFGLTCSPRVLTKVIKPIIAFLRLTFAILVSIYLDDMLLQSQSPELCILHMEILCLVFMALGWSFKWSKCSLVPSQQFHHLGFDWNTKTMTISCPQRKVIKLQSLCSEAFSSASVTVLKLEVIIGTMESVKPAVPLTNLYLRSLQKQLIASKHHDRNPNEIIFLSQTSMDELKWWISPMGFAANCSAPIRYWDLFVDGGLLSLNSGDPQQHKTLSLLQRTCQPNPGNLERCQPVYGWIPLIPRCFQAEIMDKVGVVKETPHQFVGVESCQRKSLSGSGRRHCPSPFGLSSSRLLHPLSRRNQELSLVKRSSASLERSSGKKGHFVDPALAQHQGQQHGGLPQPQQDDPVGVHVVEVGVQTCPGDIGGVPDPGRVREQRHAPAAPLHVLVPGQSRGGAGRNDPSLGPSQLPVPAVTHGHEVSPEDQSGEDQSHHDHPPVAVLPVVASGSGDVGGASSSSSSFQGSPDNDERRSASIPEPTSSSSPVPQELSKFLSNHLAPRTSASYKSNFGKFELFCSSHGADPTSCSPEVIARFVQHLYETGASYSTVNSARSAISKYHHGFNGVPAGQHSLVCQSVRAVFRLRPPIPKYLETFDIVQVFDYLKSLPPNPELSLKALSYKALFLLIASSLSRVSSVAQLGPHLLVYKVSTEFIIILL